MEMLDLRLRLSEEELLDAAENLRWLLECDGDGEVLPPFRRLLLALDDVITDAYAALSAERPGSRGPLTSP
jgi:hypothetical protein